MSDKSTDRARKVPRRVLDFAVGGLFLYAGVNKALDPAHFAMDIFHFLILPWTAGALLALYLPWLEMLCGAALIIRRCYMGALVLLAALLVLFLAALGAAWFRGLDIHCGCFGQGHPQTILQTAWHDLVLLAAVTYLGKSMKEEL